MQIKNAIAAALAVSAAVLCGTMRASAAVTYADLYTLAPGYSRMGLSNYHVAAGGQVVGQAVPLASSHALLWNGTSIPTDLNPTASGYTTTVANGVNAGYQVGSGRGSTPTHDETHALLWHSSNVAIDLHPSSAYLSSEAYGVGDGYQVGHGQISVAGDFHALLWHGSSPAVDLHPATGFTSTTAYGVGGGYQVGVGSTGGQTHALLWHGSNVAVDLNPASGYAASLAYSVADGQQVGYGFGSATGNALHAMLWSGAADSYVDLNPSASDFTTSVAYGVAAGLQVGSGSGTATGGATHALFWSGSADSYIDLQNVLPASMIASVASSITGNTVYGYAIDRSSQYHAIVWTVPEPSSLAVLGLCATSLARRKRLRRR